MAILFFCPSLVYVLGVKAFLLQAQFRFYYTTIPQEEESHFPNNVLHKVLLLNSKKKKNCVILFKM